MLTDACVQHVRTTRGAAVNLVEKN